MVDSNKPAGELGGRVLVVDDNELLFRILTIELGRHYELRCVATVADARAAVEASELAAIVCDWSLGPGQDGIAFFTAVAEMKPGIRRVLTSGRARNLVVERALESGVIHAFVEKPWTLGTLRDVLRDLLKAT